MHFFSNESHKVYCFNFLFKCSNNLNGNGSKLHEVKKLHQGSILHESKKKVYIQKTEK